MTRAARTSDLPPWAKESVTPCSINSLASARGGTATTAAFGFAAGVASPAAGAAGTGSAGFSTAPRRAKNTPNNPASISTTNGHGRGSNTGPANSLAAGFCGLTTTTGTMGGIIAAGTPLGEGRCLELLRARAFALAPEPLESSLEERFAVDDLAALRLRRAA